MTQKRGNLKPAHHGYRYQDLATAYVLAESLVHRYDAVMVDRKEVEDDRVDDLGIRSAGRRVRVQFKSSRNPDLRLSTSQFTAETSSLRIDRLVLTFVRAGPLAADEYRICATWRVPDEAVLLELLEPADVPGIIAGWPSRRFRLRGERVWPAGGAPLWPWLGRPGEPSREELLAFCARTIVELELPPASESLTTPGPLERALLAFLAERVGIGQYPNDRRSPGDVAALAVALATLARTQEAELTPEDVEGQLSIRTDYGRVAQAFPIDRNVLQDRPLFRRSVHDAALRGQHLLVTGQPGAGKSWELTQLAEELRKAGTLVARHYCYLEPGDELVERRITEGALFGNLMNELSEAEPSLRAAAAQRYAATLRSLEEFLAAAAESGHRVVLIIDGLDHIARVRATSRSVTEDESDIVGQIATLALPDGAALVIGSQPGAHLDPLREAFGTRLAERTVPPWSTDEVSALALRLGVGAALEAAGEPGPASVLDLLAERSEGNPLYATILSRGLADRLSLGALADAREWLEGAPVIEGEISAYYSYLYAHAGEVAQMVADVLGVIAFAITEADLQSILPRMLEPWIGRALRDLRPVLVSVAGQGGVRVFHESFRRFITEELVRRGRSVAEPLDHVVRWLSARGFYSDAKAYRFLLPALRRANRDDEALALVGVTFVSESVAHGHPADAAQRNLSVAMEVAARTLRWADLVRLVELHRALYICYEDRLDEALPYWQAYAELFGPEALSERLLFDGKPTQDRETGLLLCSLADDAGAAPPWREYLDMPDEPEDRDLPPGLRDEETARLERISLSMIHGWFRTEGVRPVANRLFRFLVTDGKHANSRYVRNLAARVARSASVSVLRAMLARGTDPARRRSLAPRVAADLRLVLAREYARQGDAARGASYAASALPSLRSLKDVIECVRLGAELSDGAARAPDPSAQLLALGEHSPEAGSVGIWIAAVRLLAGTADAALEKEWRRVEGEGWYRCWLRYVIALARAEAAGRTGCDGPGVLDAFAELSRDVRPFAGTPPPRHLFQIRDLIRETIAWGMSLLRTTEEWESALNTLRDVLNGTGTMLDRSLTGPLHPQDLLEEMLSFAERPEVAPSIRAFAEEQVADAEAVGTYFESHASLGMLLARILRVVGEQNAARGLWGRIGVFLGGYGWRKDVTIYELTESAPALMGAGREEALAAFAAVQPLADALLRHTDGRSTNHAPNAWLRNLLAADPGAGLTILARRMNTGKGAVGWPIETALEDALGAVADTGDPQLIADLYAALPFEPHDIRDATDRVRPQLRVIGRLAERDRGRGTAAFQQLAAQVSGEGGRHHSGPAISLLLAFAQERGIPFPVGESTRPPAARDGTTGNTLPARWASVAEGILWGISAPTFTVAADGIRLVAGIRRPRQTRRLLENRDPDAFANAFGYRLVGLVQSGREDEAFRLLRLAAREERASDSGVHPLADLAVGLDRHGCHRAAALAYALAYAHSRGGGGYHVVGDVEQERLLLRAFELGGNEARIAFAAEIAYRLRGPYGNYGITRALVERAAAWGEPRVALQCWWAAHKVIAHRLPLTSDAEPGMFPRLDPENLPGWAVNEGVVAVLLGRLNHPVLSRKVPAAVGLARAIRRRPDALARPLGWYLCQDGPLTSVLLVLQLLLECEEEPYPVTHALAEVISGYAVCEIWGARYLAELLLGRARLDVPEPPPFSCPVEDVAPPQNLEKLLSVGEGDRVDSLAQLWPEFPALVGRRVDFLFGRVDAHLDESRDRLKLALGDSMNVRPTTPVLRWETELFETALHEVLNGLRPRLWDSGAWSPDLELEVLRVVAPDAAAHLGVQASRIARPPYPAPSELFSAVGEVPVLDEQSGYPGWHRLGYVEHQWLRSSSHSHPALTGTASIYAGAVVLPHAGFRSGGLPPLGDGELFHWWLPEAPPLSPKIPLKIPLGPLSGLALARDWLGHALILVPPLGLRSYLALGPANRGGPLEWQDHEGRAAVVLQNWRVRDARIYRPEPAEFKGAELIVRPDIFAWICEHASGPIRECRRIHSERTTGLEESIQQRA